MEIRKMKVSVCSRLEIRHFIEKWHYSHSINGLNCSFCFKLEFEGVLIGAMIYGKTAMAGVWRKYATREDDLIELRRLCCIDDTPKNTESFFIGKTLKWLKRNTNILVVVSYSDMSYGHSGVIYKASNFELVGQTSPGRVIIFDGKRYHDKAIRTKNKGVIKPFAIKIIAALKSGEAIYQKTLPKNIYLYPLKNRKFKTKEHINSL